MSVIGLSTHVLYLGDGQPAAGLRVCLATAGGSALSAAETDSDGRVRDWPGASALEAGTYRLEFATGAWFRARGESCFHPRVVVDFELAPGGGHYHVPLLLNRFGYSTYRGS